MNPNPRLPSAAGAPARQRGVALVVGLVFLLITTLMAVTAMSGVIMQERMAGNLKNASVAQAGAESALRAGENWLRNYYLTSAGNQALGNSVASLGVYGRDTDVPIPFVDSFRAAKTWNDTPGGAVVDYPTELIPDTQLSEPDGGNMAARPQYIIEDISPLRPPGARGKESGADDTYGGYQMSSDCAARIFRITGRSTGSSRNVMRVAESSYSACTGA
jgi:type IV pilus assembly protein PilX